MRNPELHFQDFDQATNYLTTLINRNRIVFRFLTNIRTIHEKSRLLSQLLNSVGIISLIIKKYSRQPTAVQNTIFSYFRAIFSYDVYCNNRQYSSQEEGLVLNFSLQRQTYILTYLLVSIHCVPISSTDKSGDSKSFLFQQIIHNMACTQPNLPEKRHPASSWPPKLHVRVHPPPLE